MTGRPQWLDNWASRPCVPASFSRRPRALSIIPEPQSRAFPRDAVHNTSRGDARLVRTAHQVAARSARPRGPHEEAMGLTVVALQQLNPKLCFRSKHLVPRAGRLCGSSVGKSACRSSWPTWCSGLPDPLLLRGTIAHNVGLGLALRGVSRATRRTRIESVPRLLRIAHLAKRSVATLSEARRSEPVWRGRWCSIRRYCFSMSSSPRSTSPRADWSGK